MSLKLDVSMNVAGITRFKKALKKVEEQLLHKVDEFLVLPLFEKVLLECPKKTGKLKSSLRKKTTFGRKKLRVDITAEGAVNETGRSYLSFILEGQEALSSRGRYIPGIGKRRKARKAMDSAIQEAGGHGKVGETQRTVEYRARAHGIKTTQFNELGRYPKKKIPPNPFHQRAHDKWLRSRAPRGLRLLQEWIDQVLRGG